MSTQTPKDTPTDRQRATHSIFQDWHRLPTELKLQVLAHHLTFEGIIDVEGHLKIMEEELDIIIDTNNRDFVALSLETYYQCNAFSLKIAYRRVGKTIMSLKVKSPSRTWAARIQTLHIHVDDCELFAIPGPPPDPRQSTWPRQNTWPLFPKASKESEEADRDSEDEFLEYYASRSLAWQSSFLNLKELKLTFLAPDGLWYSDDTKVCPECEVSADDWKQMEMRLAESTNNFRARKVQITFEMNELRLACSCTAQLESMMVQMMTKMEHQTAAKFVPAPHMREVI
ncbi:hypothetical protein HBI46_158350 [Parastagonospora nodorum]|nr:hypothetical protein HBI46_158350 [Parastagonospora nodorum]